MTRRAPTSFFVLVVAAFGGLAALALGYWGYQSVPNEQLSASDALFQSMQLFALEGGVPDPGTPWQLDIARFLAPLVVASAAIVALLALVKEEATRARVRMLKKHVVVIGLGDNGSVVSRALAKAGERVVGIEIDATRVSALGGGSTNLIALRGDGTDATLLRKANVGRASHVIVFAGDDARNLRVLEAVQAVIDNQPRPPMVHVCITDVSLWRELQSRSFVDTESGVVEYFNLDDRTALSLVDAANLDAISEEGGKVLLVGATQLAIRVASHVVRQLRVRGRPTTLILNNGEARDQEAQLSSQEPWIFEEADVRKHDPDDAASFDVAFVLQGSDAEGMSTAAELSRRVESVRRLAPA